MVLKQKILTLLLSHATIVPNATSLHMQYLGSLGSYASLLLPPPPAEEPTLLSLAG